MTIVCGTCCSQFELEKAIEGSILLRDCCLENVCKFGHLCRLAAMTQTVKRNLVTMSDTLKGLVDAAVVSSDPEMRALAQKLRNTNKEQ